MIGDFCLAIAANLTTELIKTKLKKIPGDEAELKNILKDIIYNTIDEYSKKFPVAERYKMIAFYDSQIFLTELLRYRLLEGYELNEFVKNIPQVLKKNRNIILPDEKDLSEFYAIFMKNLKEKEDKIQHLEIKINYTYDVVYLSNILGSLREELSLLKNRLTNLSELFEVRNNKLQYKAVMLLKAYKKAKVSEIENEEWPYVIDRKIFVDSFDYKTGTFLERKQKLENSRCIPFLLENLKKQSCFCVAYYGMGKTTIAKFLFMKLKRKHTLYPIFLKLTLEELSDYTGIEKLKKAVYNEIGNTLLGATSLFADILFESVLLQDNLRNEISQLMQEQKIYLIFDGIDESINSPNDLQRFAEFLNRFPFRFFLTSRLEFFKFFSVFKKYFNTTHNVLELLEWQKPQWDIYIQALRQKHIKDARKQALLDGFDQQLKKNAFKDLPRRLLFLKMLSDLYIDNRTSIHIEEELKGNLAKIYYEFIRWKIRDDFERKRSHYGDKTGREELPDVDDFVEFTFVLFKELALKEYSRTVPDIGAIAYIEDPDTPFTTNSLHSGISYEDIDNTVAIIPKKKYGLGISNDTIYAYFINSTLFSAITRQQRKVFSFSHKSLMEYLVAYELVDSIFHDDLEKARCNNWWNLYQTYEVSDHLQAELIRKCFVKFSDCLQPRQMELRDRFLRKAFKDVLSDTEVFTIYSERVEEVLYYLGKFKISSPQIIDTLKKIVTKEISAHPLYIRTASISLSYIESPYYIADYVKQLVDNYLEDKTDYKLNQAIDINYYGEMNIRKRLQGYLDEYVEKGEIRNLNLFRIFSYFTSQPIISPEELNHLLQLLETVKQATLKYKHKGFYKICLRIAEIVLSFALFLK